MESLIRYFIETKEELNKVTWLSRQNLIRHSAIVIASVIVAGLIVAILDFGLTKIFELGITRI